jgi:hypothetical protein
MNDDREKINAYIDTIYNHVIIPILETDLKESCIATILLIFSSIDGLGRLAHPDNNAGVGKRFKWYINTFMPEVYHSHASALYDLRNELAHNALNFTAFISKTRMGEQHHLESDYSLGYLFVSSSVLTNDFIDSICEFEQFLDSDEKFIVRSGSRLRWLEDNTYAYWSICSTPPGPTPFINLK